MVMEGVNNCPICGGKLRYRDKVLRIVRTKYRKTRRVTIKRLKCYNCGALHRELPKYILPYKQYEAELIQGVVEKLITQETLGFEDYPCEMTMRRWQMRKAHFL